jgi:dTDP-4-dehydrorhamnose 3,5-epimerase
MKRLPLDLPDLFIIEPEVYEDSRGFFMETYRKDLFAQFGITKEFVQDSHSRSTKGVVRGLKFQFDAPTDKLVRVADGQIFAVAVDLRPRSLAFGKWTSTELSSGNKHELYLPFGFAFGFCTLSETADVIYKLSAVHSDKGSGTIRWNDEAIGIAWPEPNPIVSLGDQNAPTFKEWVAAGGPKAMGGP